MTPRDPMQHGPWLDSPDGTYCGECLLLRWTIEKFGAGCRARPRRGRT
jgi:hypothetical protein